MSLRITDEGQGKRKIVATIDETISISEDTELIKLVEKDRELQKQVDEIDKKRKEALEKFQGEAASLLAES